MGVGWTGQHASLQTCESSTQLSHLCLHDLDDGLAFQNDDKSLFYDWMKL